MRKINLNQLCANSKIRQKNLFKPLLLLIFIMFPYTSNAQEFDSSILEGQWYFNQELSDVTDKKVEEALKAMGQKIERRLFDRRKDKYRGGPEEQELYDRISYDNTLKIQLLEDRYLFTYDDNYQRPVFLDNRSRSVSLTGLSDIEDFSFAHQEDQILLVEGRPRDGGFSNERYLLSDDEQLLTVEMYILPGSFTSPIELTRIYTRSPNP